MPAEGPDDFDTQYQFSSISGTSLSNCYAIGYRTPFEEPFSPLALESWVIQSVDDEFNFLFGTENWLTGLWLAPGGPLYVADNSDSQVKRCEDLQNGVEQDAWQTLKIDLQPLGIWGLPDGTVYVWGRQGEKTALRVLDGKKWRPMPCPGAMSQLHGLAPDQLWAAGYEGLLARWDGRKWSEISVETDSNFTGLNAVSRDEIWATTEGGELFEGSKDGWALRARNPSKGEPLYDVARWNGDLWVAGGDAGLLKLRGKGRKLEVVKPNLDAGSLDTRDELIMSCMGKISGTPDGKDFTSRGRLEFIEFRKDDPPIWEE
jgi:hypothetical protein